MRVISAFFPIAILLVVTRCQRSLASSTGSSNYNGIPTGSVERNIEENRLIQESLDDLSAKIKEFQKEDAQQQGGLRRPFVTLAYAQSIDGKIALVTQNESIPHDETLDTRTAARKTKTSSNFAISGPESLRLTHALRSIHDAILIGGNTLSVDNPRLTNRLWPPPDEHGKTVTNDAVKQKPCVPVILDTHLHHIRLLGNAMRAQNPIVCCSPEAYEQASSGIIPPSAILLPCKTKVVKNKDNEKVKTVLDLQDVLSKLHQEHGIDSLMVEGGASVLSLFVEETCDEDDEEENNKSKPLFDYLCVTISPKLLGANGLDSLSSLRSYPGSSSTAGSAILGPLKCITLGEDCVLFADRQR